MRTVPMTPAPTAAVPSDTDTTPHGADRRHWWTRGLALVLVLVLVVAVAPPIWTRGVAFTTVADALGWSVPRPFAPAVTTEVLDADGVEVDRYRPQGPPVDDRGLIVLLPGAAPDGRQDARVVTVARALARADRVVVVPELEVYDEELVPADLDRIVRVVTALDTGERALVLTGISFGGSLGLVAAADPEIADRVDLVATFGAYADLGGVVQAATTGSSLVDGERIPWTGDPRAADVVRDQVLRLLDEEARDRLQRVLDGDDPPGSLPSELRAAHDLLRNDDPARTPELVAALPSPVRERIAAVSPARAAADLPAPVVAMHAVDDPIIPYGELARLERALPQVESMTLTTFDHVGLGTSDGPGRWESVRDIWTVTRFVTRVLRAG